MSRLKLGAATSGVEISPKKRKRLAKQRAAEAKSWAAKSGEVKVYFRDPATVEAIDGVPGKLPASPSAQ